MHGKFAIINMKIWDNAYFRPVRQLQRGREGGEDPAEGRQHPGREHCRQRRVQGVHQVEGDCLIYKFSDTNMSKIRTYGT